MAAEALTAISNALAETVAAVAPSVVRVEGRRRIAGSGIVWSEEGIIVTAEHVLAEGDEVTIGLEGGRTTEAKVLRRDPSIDVAVLKAQAGRLNAPSIAGLENVRTGNLVLALGRPGRIIRTSMGVVSALGEAWETPREGRLEAYLETDVRMLPGFSGGPLLDVQGNLLGLNTSRLVRGASLTIPVLTLRQAVDGIVGGRIGLRAAYLGVGIQPVRLPPSIETQVGQETGLLVTLVEAGSPAEQNGLLLGDIILSVAGNPTRYLNDLTTFLSTQEPGTAIPFMLVRAGQLHGRSVVLGERR